MAISKDLPLPLPPNVVINKFAATTTTQYSTIKLVPITRTFRKYPELVNILNTYISACKAAIQQSSDSITATKCLCKGNCLKNHCKYKK
ncbi:3126_t:CDS:2, partial [Cetraspora pellucida]